MKTRWILAFTTLLWPAAANAEITIENLTDSIRAIPSVSPAMEDCDRQVAAANSMNAPQLIYGSVVCFAAKQIVNGSFLMVASQIRAVSDLQAFKPDEEPAKAVAMKLYGMLYQFGGGGPNEVYRDPISRAAFFAALDAWKPELGPTYSPGWRLSPRPTSSAYDALLNEIRMHRREQLEGYAKLISDDRYYAMETELQALRARNPRGFVAGTPDGVRFMELMRTMGEISGSRR